MEDKTRFTLRIPTSLYNIVKEEAVKNKRSVVKEIEFILENATKNASTIEKPPKK